MKSFLKKTTDWLGLTNAEEIIDACFFLAFFGLIFVMILVRPDTEIFGIYLDDGVLILSIMGGLGILYSIYHLLWGKRYADKRYYPIIILFIFTLLLVIMWTRLKPESDRLREMEKKWRIESVCTEKD